MNSKRFNRLEIRMIVGIELIEKKDSIEVPPNSRGGRLIACMTSISAPKGRGFWKLGEGRKSDPGNSPETKLFDHFPQTPAMNASR